MKMNNSEFNLKNTAQWEKILFAVILLLAFLTRFSELGVRAMSHDESLHTYYSYLFADVSGYAHNPMMHGPLQFHLLNASYQLLGVTDFTARIPAALCGVLSIALVWLLRKDLGKVGTFVAMGLFLISPYLLFYSRYVRNEALLMPIAILTLWSILRYFQTEDKQYLLWLTVVSALNFTIKETAFFYTAQAMVFAGFVFLIRADQRKWALEARRKNYYLLLMGTVVAIMLGFLMAVFTNVEGKLNSIWFLGGVVLGFVLAVVAVHMLREDMGKENFAHNPALAIIISLGTIVLPMLSPLVVNAIGLNPLNYDVPQVMLYTGLTIGALFIVSFLIGIWWDLKTWMLSQVTFYGIFTVFYTSFFSNPDGFYTGLVGSLGYWLEQQGVARGSQPWYYYLLVQLPVYEYLPFLGSLIGLGLVITLFVRSMKKRVIEKNQFLFPALMAFWSFSSLAVFTYAGEKMPWLTVHIVMPMILMTAWTVRYAVMKVDWKGFKSIQYWGFGLSFIIVALVDGVLMIGQLLGTHAPFSGMLLTQLEDTNLFIGKVLLMGISVYILIRLFKKLDRSSVKTLFLLTAGALLCVTTFRTSFAASFKNFDQGNEYLVYAHSGAGVKNVLDEIEWISMQTMDGKSIPISYDGETSWPMTWYFRDYRNAQVFYVPETTDEDGTTLMEVPEFVNPIVILDDKSFANETEQLQNDYIAIETIRMVWPNQDYFKGLIGETFFKKLGDPAYRAAFFDIWWNRDFSSYSALNGYEINQANWTPADRMRLYISRDYAADLWNYGLIEETADE